MKVAGPGIRLLVLFLLTSAMVLAPLAAPTAVAATVLRVPCGPPAARH